MQRNSSYSIHADELLADNFALVMEWRRSGVVPAAVPGGPGAGFPVTDVRLLEAMEEVLTAGDGRMCGRPGAPADRSAGDALPQPDMAPLSAASV